MILTHTWSFPLISKVKKARYLTYLECIILIPAPFSFSFFLTLCIRYLEATVFVFVLTDCVCHKRPDLWWMLHILCAQCEQPSVECWGKPCLKIINFTIFLVLQYKRLDKYNKNQVLISLLYNILKIKSIILMWPQVKEHEKKSSLGKLTLPLVRLLNISDMTMDQRFQLERSGANSQIKMKAVLRVSDWTKADFIYFLHSTKT